MSDTTETATTAPEPEPKQPPKDDFVYIRVQLTEEQIEAQFAALFNRLSNSVCEVAKSHGFWENPNQGEKIALTHSELSEALEYIRKNPEAPDNHIPGFTGVEAEFADVVIRLMDFAAYYKLRLGEAIIAKHKYNVNRPYKHGKKF